MTVSLVWAEAKGGVLGAEGRLPWHLPEDLRLFRSLTWGSTVVMGRRTWESLPARFRPLPGRTNVVLTSRPGWAAEGAEVATSVGAVVAEYEDLWVVGGSSAYSGFLPHASRVVLTRIDADFAGDTWAPVLGPEWHRVSRDPVDGWSVSSTGLRYAVSEFARRHGAGAARA